MNDLVAALKRPYQQSNADRVFLMREAARMIEHLETKIRDLQRELRESAEAGRDSSKLERKK